MGSKQSTSQKKKPGLAGLVVVIIPVAIAILAYFIYFADNNDQSDAEDDSSAYSQYEFQKQGELSFLSHDYTSITDIDIEIADNSLRRSEGLMYRDSMAENQGMLFIFPEPATQSFWMKNTILSLDMIFVGPDSQIVTIHKETEPFADIHYIPTSPVQYVIEVNAGFTDKYLIEVGDRIRWSRL